MQVRYIPNEHSRKTLLDLPVELIEEIYMLALSSAFPQTCKWIYSTVKSFLPSAHAYYILGRHPLKTYMPFSSFDPALDVSSTISSALRYPITNSAVVKALYNIILRSYSKFGISPLIELPRRLFRSLDVSDATRDANSDPIPFLRVLWEEEDKINVDFPQLNASSHGGYPLECAVHAEFIPLVQFLCDHGASPALRNYVSLRMAIGKKDLKLVKILAETEDKPEARGRLKIHHSDCLDMAARCGARDIVKYLIEERGCVPPAKNLRSRSGEYSLCIKR